MRCKALEDLLLKKGTTQGTSRDRHLNPNVALEKTLQSVSDHKGIKATPERADLFNLSSIVSSLAWKWVWNSFKDIQWADIVSKRDAIYLLTSLRVY